MQRDELLAWLMLLGTPRLGRTAGRALLAAFGSPSAVFSAPPNALRSLIGAAKANALLARKPGDVAELVTSTLAWLGEVGQRHLITLADGDYPSPLLNTDDPPVLLYGMGRRELLQANSIAVVGTRSPSPQGAENARSFGQYLSQRGWTIVSGLAQGIDAHAHQGGLEGEGRTIAVVGTGLDRVYPSSHRALAHQIAQEGLLISEYPIGTPPLPAHFPQRNRIIAGLARGTLVVEAALASGSLITARLAAESGREVFAIPGSIHAPQSKGCHALIKQGAKLVEAGQDILEELGSFDHAPNVSTLQNEPATDTRSLGSEPEAHILRALGAEMLGIDELCARTGYDSTALNIHLLNLELDGRLGRLPGGIFQAVWRG